MLASVPVMDDSKLNLLHPPIVEAIVDIDCDLPPRQDLAALEEPTRERLKDRYPKLTNQYVQEYKIEAQADASEISSGSRKVQAFRFHETGDEQLVQVRTGGYSFNRLPPYTVLDDYLPEIERTWGIYVELAAPTQVQQIRLRYINRILLPMSGSTFSFDRYLRLGPRLPEQDKLAVVSFFNQYTAVEAGTGLQVNTTLTAQPQEGNVLPVIFDNCVISSERHAVDDWGALKRVIVALRGLKNRVFRNTLTDECLELFQQP